MILARRLFASGCFAFGAFYCRYLFTERNLNPFLIGVALLVAGWGLWRGRDGPALGGLYGYCALLALLIDGVLGTAVVFALCVTVVYALVRRRRHQVAWLVDQGITDKQVQKITNEFNRDMGKLERRYKQIIDKYTSKLAKLKG